MSRCKDALLAWPGDSIERLGRGADTPRSSAALTAARRRGSFRLQLEQTGLGSCEKRQRDRTLARQTPIEGEDSDRTRTTDACRLSFQESARPKGRRFSGTPFGFHRSQCWFNRSQLATITLPSESFGSPRGCRPRGGIFWSKARATALACLRRARRLTPQQAAALSDKVRRAQANRLTALWGRLLAINKIDTNSIGEGDEVGVECAVGEKTLRSSCWDKIRCGDAVAEQHQSEGPIVLS
ncbi:hypothetical protein ACVWYJ_005694 [Bradyrhizobium sp. USDA 4471]